MLWLTLLKVFLYYHLWRKMSFAVPIILWMLAIWSRVLLHLLNPTCTLYCFYPTYYWSLDCKSFSIILLVCKSSMWDKHNCSISWTKHCPFLVLEYKLFFHFFVCCWVFHICLQTADTNLTAWSGKILNSSAGLSSTLQHYLQNFLETL